MHYVVLIPALIRNEPARRDMDLLLRTVDTIPTDIDTALYVVLQGSTKDKSDVERRRDPRIVLIYCPAPAGKWGAVSLGVEEVRRRHYTHPYVLILMDADRAFEGADIPKLADPINRGISSHTIGRRQGLRLPTPGVREELRIFVELYFNTLLILRLGLEPTPNNAFDIQCGFHGLHSSFVERLDLSKLPRFYGGEAAIFVQSVRAENRPSSVDVCFVLATQASFSIDTVFHGLMEIDVIAQTSYDLRRKALNLTPALYRHWLPDADEFRRIVGKYLSRMGFLTDN